MTKRFAVVALVAVLAALVASCQPAEQLATELYLNHGTEPPTVDPNLATDTTSIDTIMETFMSLTLLNVETVATEPFLATEWSNSSDGLTWTFKMRKDVNWVKWDSAAQKATVQRPVTAHDIEYSTKRTCNPETASDYAYVNYIVKGCEAVNTGESTDLDSIGVKALDDYTIEFTLEQPAGYFPAIAGMWINMPVPREPIEEFGDKWGEPENIWTNGPYVLDTWEHENRMVLKKNPLWYGAKDVTIETINFAMVVETSTAFAMYENGELDVAAVPLEDMDRVKADPVLSKEFKISPVLCTYYYGFNTTKPPLDNVKVRQALSHGIDRQKLVDTVLKGGQKPAQTFACPGIFGTPAENPDFPGIKFDPAKGKALLAEAGYPDGAGLADITLMFNTSEGHQKIAEFIQQSWKENLGIDVKLANQEWAVYLDTVYSDDTPQIYRMGWCQDYPDENNWVFEVFHPTKSANNTHWSGPDADEFARLVEAAAASADPDERIDLYFEAEKLLAVDSAVMAPIYYYTRVGVTKPYLERTWSVHGHDYFWTWKVKAH